LTAGDPKPESFEDLLARLEKTVEQLAEGSAPLDELVSAHEQAGRLLAQAQVRLAVLKLKAEALSAQLRP
jgi:exodeoxyribonuclease VII small subunit